MLALSFVLIGGGLLVTAWGLPAAHRLRRPWGAVAALAVLGGVVSALTGVLLAVVPHFFG
ncbi:hypothetical protein KIP69_15150 [Geobacter sulfurreducens]|jgi:hypothetical protein|uniref:Uncharacterized protein n=1 Tax=Geobacter sulfurreducens (strain ATCC 51573 / DSM 12127 / PCA) TaxID=243231 RepID=Q748A0_GEOSL|nr:hypothetical protein [Geobacter sulfurreducens]AAR36506.1 hypothetical protein GSU3115 [Geobacter sulfurreducens PCA]ADI85866.1 hypothetical protein KN400_3054 [Geobacter sulfurreducens KN400]AJY69354.1 hypothetical protein RW64_06890 [Geobacter sulfurreducens]QVW34909.1 hypothetical protein KIP69_15150 [Geobacter sulfurreducens]UAC03780.1 hypothetical protein KVP06_15660 [Geobacter sulfurreducens]